MYPKWNHCGCSIVACRGPLDEARRGEPGSHGGASCSPGVAAILRAARQEPTMARHLTVLMPFHTPFYAPLAAGVALGHFSEEGLDVSVFPAAAFGKGTIRALLDGDIELSL